VYRNIDLRQEILGVEPLDGFALAGVFGLLAFIHRHGAVWNVLVTVIAYVALRIAKRGKPEGYTLTLVRFFRRRPYFSAAAADRELDAHAFGPTRSPNGHDAQPGGKPCSATDNA
jgi:hypothetical protein